MAVYGTNVALPSLMGEPYAEMALTGVTSTLLLVFVYSIDNQYKVHT